MTMGLKKKQGKYRKLTTFKAVSLKNNLHVHVHVFINFLKLIYQ